MLDMNQMQSPKESPSLKDMTYLLRFVTNHEGQGGGSQDQEGLIAHYFGYVCNFATAQWFQLDDDEIMEVEEEDFLRILRIRPTCCITCVWDLRSTIFVTRKIYHSVILQ